MKAFLIFFFAALGTLALAAVAAIAPAVIIYYAWNLVAVPMFAMKVMTFLQALLIGWVLSLLGSMVRGARK